MPELCPCPKVHEDIVNEIIRVNDELAQLKDLDAILDRVLTRARKVTRADAGTIYLVEDGRLRFSYVHNDTLFTSSVNKEVYANFSMPMNDDSIVGYAAGHRELIAIDDAYDMPADSPVRFNPAFDIKTGYRTRSILTFPITTSQGSVVGVIQIINAKDDNGESVPFSEEARHYLPLFATTASVAIERAIMTRELILRMIQMAELRDPSETGAHVQRVGAYSAEIYHQWALNKGVPEHELKKFKDHIRIAAMLHDVGKVGISDAILKKPAKLDPDEFATMQFHTVFGAKLFTNSTSELDAMSGEIALRHHEKWNGNGYPGRVSDLHGTVKSLGQPLSGKAIPLAARICALADVFDALSSRRTYKPPWPDEKIITVIKEDSGTHFDPDVVESFLSIWDVVTAIREKFTENLPEDERPNPQDDAAKKVAEDIERKRVSKD
ncbi:HD-GYP domain-containing protein (c-di-GMP phosphodiesterase class II) [Desulfobaculum xiamenense]|uniref:HD-GYP domain-containing protein (C-di-GMP phosphodiesterase class II) n=1 Tax=Desulfobaculum xiamenense TaxID=995050 RepID=A0A846QQJ3_9BACT|nr:HD domain-containing phosphohydrolase [Desulfobaculum xiamenense]NJB68623.1 HD-GYP domain-containing protein (c-di-GMP phosphodiesterase class II) [Desulfobaculum xiamenense]